MPNFKSKCHDTLAYDASCFHDDTKAVGIESIAVFTLGSKKIAANLPEDGELAAPRKSGLLFPAFKTQIMIGAMGSGGASGIEEGDVCCVDACTPEMTHGNVGRGARGAYLRSLDAIYDGGAILDHEGGYRVSFIPTPTIDCLIAWTLVSMISDWLILTASWPHLLALIDRLDD